VPGGLGGDGDEVAWGSLPGLRMGAAEGRSIPSLALARLNTTSCLQAESPAVGPGRTLHDTAAGRGRNLLQLRVSPRGSVRGAAGVVDGVVAAGEVGGAVVSIGLLLRDRWQGDREGEPFRVVIRGGSGLACSLRWFRLRADPGGSPSPVGGAEP
jgi:hypothetical protein